MTVVRSAKRMSDMAGPPPAPAPFAPPATAAEASTPWSDEVSGAEDADLAAAGAGPDAAADGRSERAPPQPPGADRRPAPSPPAAPFPRGRHRRIASSDARHGWICSGIEKVTSTTIAALAMVEATEGGPIHRCRARLSPGGWTTTDA